MHQHQRAVLAVLAVPVPAHQTDGSERYPTREQILVISFKSCSWAANTLLNQIFNDRLVGLVGRAAPRHPLLRDGIAIGVYDFCSSSNLQIIRDVLQVVHSPKTHVTVQIGRIY